MTSSELSEDALRALPAFCRLARSLRNVDLAGNLSWERLSTLGVVILREPISITQISIAESVGASAVSRTVSTLQRQALVRCVPDGDDRRSLLVSSTPRGRAAIEKGLVRTLERLAEVLSTLDDAEFEAMARVIRQARDGKRGG
jgi:DNA-binding MarR family transcriptional regulator